MVVKMKQLLMSALAVLLITLCAVPLTLAQQLTGVDGSRGGTPSTPPSWLDRPLSNWNRPGGALPRLPDPVPPDAAGREMASRCGDQIRKPSTAAERALVRRGWLLFGPVQSYGTTRVITALSGFDGMCRPLGYNAFVYSEGRYAATLSPVAMNARTDGALIDFRLRSATMLSGQFDRYAATDPLCCPSGTATVTYSIRPDDVPDMMATGVSQSPRCEAAAPAAQPAGPSGKASLSEHRWVLIRINATSFSDSRPYIEFDSEKGMASGSTGCNRFSSRYLLDRENLRFSGIASTRMACVSEERQGAEKAFLAGLQSVSRYEITGSTLRLYAGDALVLELVAR